jgi:hypothetical protein
MLHRYAGYMCSATAYTASNVASAAEAVEHMHGSRRVGVCSS